MPLLKDMKPEELLEFIGQAEKAAAKARQLSHKVAHAASLTDEEQYQGWAPLLMVLYRFWQGVAGPQVEFGIQTQIGVAQALNKFGAGIDVSGMEKVLLNVRRTIKPFEPTKPPDKPLNITASEWVV